MSGIVRVAGGGDGAFAPVIDHLRAAAFEIERPGSAACASVLISWSQGEAEAIAAACAFAELTPAHPAERLVVQIWRTPSWRDWAATRNAATLAAFTRHAARNWAGRRVRVNALSIGGGPANGDVAATIQALWRWRSMTGQIIHLGDPPAA